MPVDQTLYPLAMADDPTTGKPMPVMGAQLMGSNVELLWLPALAITDTAAHYLGTIDVSDCDSFGVIAISTLNQQATLSLTQPNGHGIQGYALLNPVATANLAIPGSANTQVYQNWNTKGLKSINAYVICGTAPTSGSLSIYLVKKARGN